MRFGGKITKTDNQTGANWNDATVNERERVGVTGSGPQAHISPVKHDKPLWQFVHSRLLEGFLKPV